MTDLTQVIAECVQAYKDAALVQFVRDGSQDCGTCGGAMLAYRGNTKFAKALYVAGIGRKMDGGMYVSMRSGHPTQHAEVEIQGLRAFRAKAAEHGFESTKFWTYVD